MELAKEKSILYFVACVLSKGIFSRLCFILMYIVLNTLSEYIQFYISKKHYFIHFCCLFLKSLKAFSVSLIIMYCSLKSSTFIEHTKRIEGFITEYIYRQVKLPSHKMFLNSLHEFWLLSIKERLWKETFFCIVYFCSLKLWKMNQSCLSN